MRDHHTENFRVQRISQDAHDAAHAEKKDVEREDKDGDPIETNSIVWQIV